MRARLWSAWLAIRGSFWFVPCMMAIGAIALATGMLWLDSAVSEEWVSDLRWIHSRSNSGARDLLSTVASSMITVAGLAFSIIVVALQLASSQLGPRLLRNFMRDTGNQLVLGTFIATFLYCLLVMRTIGGELEEGPLPRLSVSVAVLLAIASLGVLIYFIHHAAASMQAPNVIAAVSDTLHSSIRTLYPEQAGEPAESPSARALQGMPGEGRVVPVDRSGYVQALDLGQLTSLAAECDIVIELCCRPGTFLVQGDPLARAWPADRIDDEIGGRIRSRCIIGAQRTPEQDVEFTAGQLVDIALRALSPSLNDPFTAVSCVEHLSSALVLLFDRGVPSPQRTGPDGRLRLIAEGAGPEHVLATAFDEVRDASGGSTLVTLALYASLERLARHARTPRTQAAVRRQLRLLEGGVSALPTEDAKHAAALSGLRITAAMGPVTPATSEPGEGAESADA